MEPTVIKVKGVFDNHGSGDAGWGAVIEAPGAPWTSIGGPIDHSVRGSTESVLVAMTNGLTAAVARKTIGAASVVEISTDGREIVATLLALVRGTTLVGDERIEPAKEIRRDIRDGRSLADFMEVVNRWNLGISFRIERGDPRALAKARAGLVDAKARA